MAKQTDQDIEEKTEAEAYTRALDTLNNYFSLWLKMMSVICGGALVSIGGGFINLLSSESKNTKDLLAMKQTLAVSFETFTWALCFVAFAAFITYASAYSYQIAYDTNEDEEGKKIKDNHEAYGKFFDHLGTGIGLYAFYLIIMGFKLLIDGFQHLSA